MNNRNENEKSQPVHDSDDEILDSRLIAYNAYMMEEDTPSLLVLVEDVDDTPF